MSLSVTTLGIELLSQLKMIKSALTLGLSNLSQQFPIVCSGLFWSCLLTDNTASLFWGHCWSISIGWSLVSIMHDGAAVVGNSMIITIVTLFILAVVPDVVPMDLDVLVSVLPFLGVDQAQDVHQLVQKFGFILLATVDMVGNLIWTSKYDPLAIVSHISNKRIWHLACAPTLLCKLDN